MRPSARPGAVARMLAAGALAGGMVLVSAAAPAAAHDRIDAHGTIKVDPAGDIGAVPTVSGVFKSTEVLGLKTENISAVSLTLAPTGPTGGDPITANGCDFATENACGTGTVTYSWTPASPPFNGPYEARATAVHCIIVCVAPSTARVTPAAFRLGIAPRPPSDLQASAGSERSVSLSWARNAEPDMLYYAVFRKMPGGADFTRVGGDVKHPASGRVSFSDTGTGDGGVLAYKVVAVRKGVSGDDKTTTTSSPSSERSATVEAPVPTTVAGVPGQPGAPSQPPQAVPAGTGVSISGFLGNQPAAKPAPGPKYLDLPDTGFGNTLPFDPPPADEELEDGEPVAPELPVAEEDTSSSDEVSLTRPLVPVAAGAILLVLAAHMRLLSRKVKEAPAPARSGRAVASDAPPKAPHTYEPYEAETYEPYGEQPEYDDDLRPAEAPVVAMASFGPESEWVEFEPPSILDSSAGGGSLLAPEPIDHYTEAAAPYYEGVPSSEPSSLSEEAEENHRRSTAVWRGPDLAGHLPDDALYDFESLDADEPAASTASVPATASAAGRADVDEGQLMGSFGFDDGAGVPGDDLVSSETPPTMEDPSDAELPAADEEAWEEEMIWEVVSPSR